MGNSLIEFFSLVTAWVEDSRPSNPPSLTVRPQNTFPDPLVLHPVVVVIPTLAPWPVHKGWLQTEGLGPGTMAWAAGLLLTHMQCSSFHVDIENVAGDNTTCSANSVKNSQTVNWSKRQNWWSPLPEVETPDTLSGYISCITYQVACALFCCWCCYCSVGPIKLPATWCLHLCWVTLRGRFNRIMAVQTEVTRDIL